MGLFPSRGWVNANRSRPTLLRCGSCEVTTVVGVAAREPGMMMSGTGTRGASAKLA